MARMGVAAAPGTGPATLGIAIFGYQTFAAAGAVNGEIFSYNLSDFDASGNLIGWEVGTGTYASSGPTLTRVPLFSSNSNAAINASALAQAWVTALVPDFAPGPYESLTSNTAIEAWKSGRVFDNYGAAGPVTVSLPPWGLGLLYTFTVAAAFPFIAAANGGDQIGFAADLFDTLGTELLYSSLTLATSALPGVWIVRNATGGWGG